KWGRTGKPHAHQRGRVRKLTLKTWAGHLWIGSLEISLLIEGSTCGIEEHRDVMHNPVKMFLGGVLTLEKRSGNSFECRKVTIHRKVISKRESSKNVPAESARNCKSSGRVWENEVWLAGFPHVVPEGYRRRQISRIPFGRSAVYPLSYHRNLVVR